MSRPAAWQALLAAVQGERHRAGCGVAGERGFGDGSGCGRVVCDDTVSVSEYGTALPVTRRPAIHQRRAKARTMSAAPIPGRQPGRLPGERAARGPPMNADDSAKLRDLLANNRTLLAYIRTALSFAGLGFAVAKFGLNPKTQRLRIHRDLHGPRRPGGDHHGFRAASCRRAYGRAPTTGCTRDMAIVPYRGRHRMRSGLRAPGHISGGQRHVAGPGQMTATAEGQGTATLAPAYRGARPRRDES
jgi:Domain of unknown function (DUF202)